MAARYKISIDAGATFQVQFEYTNPDGSLFDLTGYTAKMQIRETVEGPLVKEIFPLIDVETATVSVELSAEETAELTAPEYVYAIEIYAPDQGPTIRLVEGGIDVSPEVVR